MRADIDWPQILSDSATSLLSAIGGLIVGIWKMGRNSAHREQMVRDDYEAKIAQLSEELREKMGELERTSEAKLDLLVEQFREAFSGIRRQIDDDRLHTEREFLRKDFRDEYREDMRDLKQSIAEISNKIMRPRNG
jgi:t-SNARE complex subunit (syntaxin)